MPPRANGRLRRLKWNGNKLTLRDRLDNNDDIFLTYTIDKIYRIKFSYPQHFELF